jgi:glycosyltransferase, family 2
MAMVRRAHDEDLAIVLGSRFLEGTADTGTLKRIVLRTAAWVGSKTSGMKLTDAHNGLRLLRRDAAEKLDLHQNRMAHASEIIRQLGASGLPWAEQPVHIEYTDYSRSKGQSLWNSVNILVDLMFS